MNKKYFTFILALIFLVSPIFLNAQTKSYDAEYNRLVREYTLHEDGSYDFHYFKEIKLNTYFAFHRLFGETFIVYNPSYQELKVNEAFTVMADGKKIVAPENAFNVVLPGFARDIPAYNHLREMVVTHTGTEVGCVITLDYTIKTQKGFLPFFFGSEEIGEIVPVKELSIIVNVPQNADLKHRMLNNRTAPAITEEAGQKVFKWNFRDVPALSHASNQDPEKKEILFFSTAKDMTAAFYAFVNQPAFRSEVSSGISRRVESVTKDKQNDLDIILGMQEVVIDELKLADIPMVYSGYKARIPAVCWESANATSLEKAILLAEMLKAVNINACPVATVPNGWYSAEMGNPAAFDGYMVQVNPKETGRIYLSVTQKQSQNLIFDVQDKTMIQLDGAIESMRTFKEKPVANMLEMEGKIRLFDDKTEGREDGMTVGLYDGKMISGELEMEMEGIANPYYTLRKDDSFVKTMLVGDITSSNIETIGQDKLSELKSQYQLTITPALITKDYGSYIYFELPRYKSGFDAWNLSQFTGSDNTPVKPDFPLTENYRYELELPDGYTLYTPAADINIVNDLGELRISISQKGQTVKIARSLTLFHDVITSEKMEAFREMILAWENVNYRKIVLKKK